ncbi:hypothetical protein N9Y91_01245 [Alphaproteobacteria bacterium]|nr:hypothetical protein [Alphaproteobacteria bacterium]
MEKVIKKPDMSFMIVTRDFWPQTAAIGDTLLRLAKELSFCGETSVVTMSNQAISSLANKMDNRLSRINFCVAKPLSTSKTNLLLRLFEIFYFMAFVLFYLLLKKPDKVYVSTNPPIFIPFVIALYCKLFNKKLYYHVQDIHPEATKIILKIPNFLFFLLKRLDTWTINNSEAIITLTEDMKGTIINRGCKSKVLLVENPCRTVDVDRGNFINGIIFSGNAGRLQEMEVLLTSIEQYLDCGGNLPFTFLGGGIHSRKILEMSKKYPNFKYLGYLNGDMALKITNEHKWGLVPIKGDALKYAYPSKIASYLSAGCNLLCVTDIDSNLALWVKNKKIGIVVEPEVSQLINAYKRIELDYEMVVPSKEGLFIKIDVAAKRLFNIINSRS